MQENKFGLGILIGILVTIIIGSITFIAYDKVNGTNRNNSDENSSLNETNGTDSNNNNSTIDNKYNYTEIDKLLNENLSEYINYRVTTDGVNHLNTSEGRLELINSILMKLEICNRYDDGKMQSFLYVKYDIYKEKYNELFGVSYNLEQDLNNVISPIANDCSDISSLSGNNICWNGTWGGTINDIVLKSEKVVEMGNNNYKITGSYNNNSNNETGVFEIEYVKISGSKYLTSIKLIKK